MNLRLSKEEVNMLPLFSYSGEIVLVNSEEEKRSAVEYLCKQDLLGFDTETRPSFSAGKSYLPSLLQLASPEKVFLFQFPKLSFDEVLTQVFCSARTIKVGVAVHDDIFALQKKFSFVPANIVDLSVLARQKNIAEKGLRGLAARFLQVRISKNMRCSNWARAELTEKQLQYAATDAWVSLQIFLKMQSL